MHGIHGWRKTGDVHGPKRMQRDKKKLYVGDMADHLKHQEN